MSYRLLDVELSEPTPAIQVAARDDGLGLVSRFDGRVVGFALHPLAPGARLAPDEVEALLDPDPGLHPRDVDPPSALEDLPTLTVAVCTRDHPDLVAACLESLLTGGVSPDEVLVVDNAPSDDRTRAVAEQMGVGHVVEPCPGLDIARNRALHCATGDVVAFVDDDVIVDRHWRESLRTAWGQHLEAGAISGQILPAELETPAQVAFERRGGFRGGNRRVRYVGQDRDDNPIYPYGAGMFGAGANMSVRRTTALRLGGFDEALDTGPPLPGGGDIDMMFRVVRSGAELVYEPSAVVFHRHRRDAPGLRRQYDSWGRSSMALVAKTYRADPQGRPKLRKYVRWSFTTHARALRPGSAVGADERSAARAELRGGIAGLLGTYGRSQRRSQRLRRHHGSPVVALLPWGHVIEDYLEPIGLTLDDFADEQSGGWLFGYVEALRRAGVDTAIVCWSRSVSRATRRVHLPTGAVVWFLPSSRAYRAAASQLEDAYAWGWRGALGRSRAGAPVRATLAYLTAPFLATPPLALARVLRREGCDTLLCQEYEEGRFDISIAVGRILRVPVFATFQGGDHTRTPIERLVRRHSVRSAAGLVVGAESEVTRVQERYGVHDDFIATIPNPFDPATVPLVARSRARADLGLEAGARVVVWHGRVDVTPKGLDTLVQAWPTVRAGASGPVVLLMLGTGPGSGWLHQQLDDRDDVCWRDAYVLDRQVIGTHLSAGDVYVLPSRQEGFPVAPVEAMAAGLPVVAADAPGVRAVVGEGDGAGGTVVAVDDPPALAHALLRFLDDDELCRATGAVAARRVAAELSLDAVGARLRSFLVDR